MARKDTINVNDIVDKIINTDNIRERIKEKGEQAGKEAAKGFTSGFENGVKKGVKSSKAKASSGISIEMADFLKEMIDAVNKMEQRIQGKGYTIDMSTLIQPDWSKLGVGPKNQKKVEQAFANMIQNLYSGRAILKGSKEAIMKGFREVAADYIMEFGRNVTKGNSKSVSSQLNNLVEKSAKTLNARVAERDQKRESHNAITITNKDIDDYLKKSVEELAKILVDTYDKRDFTNNNILKNNSDKKKLIASLTSILVKNNGKIPESVKNADEIVKYAQDLYDGKIFQNISGDENYTPNASTQSKYKKAGRQLATIRDQIISRNEDWKNGRITEEEISNEETETVVKNEEKKTKAKKQSWQEEQRINKEQIKAQQQQQKKAREEQAKRVGDEHAAERIRAKDIIWDKDDNGNYKATYGKKQYIAAKTGNNYSLFGLDKNGDMKDLGKTTTSIKAMKSYLREYLNAQKDAADIRKDNQERNKRIAQQEAKDEEESVAAKERIQAKAEQNKKKREERSKKDKLLSSKSSELAELDAQRAKESQRNRSIARDEADANKKAIEATKEAEKQANEELNKQAEEMYEAELERRKKLSEITFDRKKDKVTDAYWGSDGDTYARKEGRTYSIFDKLDNKIAEGLKNLNEVDSAAQKYYKDIYESFKKNRKSNIEGFKDSIRAGLYQKPNADVVGGNQKVVESEKQVQDAVTQSAEKTKQAEEEKQQAIEETTQKIAEQAEVQNEQSSQSSDVSKDVVKTQEEVAKAAEESAEREAKAAEKSAEVVKQAEEKKQEVIKETAKTQREELSDELLEKNKQFEEYFEKFKKDYRLTKDKQTGDWISKDGRFRLELLDSSRENRHYGLYDTKEKVERSWQTPGTEPIAYPMSLDEGRRTIATILLEEEANQKTMLEQLAPGPTKKDLQEIEEKENQLKKEAEEARKAEDEARRQAEEEAKRAEEIKKKAEEERLKAEEEKKRAEEEKAKAEAEAARKEAEEKKRQAEEEQRKAEEEKRKAEEKAQKEKEKAEKKAAEAKRKAEEEARKAEEAKRKEEEEAARKAEIDARKAKMEPLPDDNIVKHSYGESGASTTVYSPHLGKTVTKNTTSEGDSFYGTQMNYQELEKRAIKLTNQLAVVNASIEIEESKSAASSQTRIDNLNAQKDILERQLEYVRAIAQAEAENDDEVENPGYTMEQFESNVAEDTELFAAQLKTKTDKEIEAIQVSNERFDTKVQEYVARKRADLSKIDSIYKSDPAYKATEDLINSFAPLDRDAFKKAELEINKSFNNLNQVIAKSRANLKGSNTLSTEKSAEFRLADAPKDIQDIINNYIKLGLTAEEAEGKVASLKETLNQINEKETNDGWASAEDYSSTVGSFLNSIRDSKNELSSYKDQVTTIDKIQRKATSALEKYLKATKVIRAGKDVDVTFEKQKKDAEKQFEQLLRIRRDYMSQAGIKDDGWEDEIRKLKESRESIINENVIDENKYKNEQKQIKITRERERLEERAYKALDQYLDLQKKVDLGQDTDGKFEEQARRRLELYEKLIKEREKLRSLESDEDPWLDHISKYREKREENIRKQVEEANKKSGLPSKADEKLRAKNERELAKAQSDAKKQSDQYGKNTANDLKQLLEKENTSIVSSFNSKKEQLKDALKKYYSDATGDPSILNELKKNVSNLFTEAFKILNNPSLTGDQTVNLQESLFDDMSDIAEKKFRDLFSESSSNIDKFEKQLLNLGYASDEVNEKISSLKVSLVGVKPGSNFINAFDPFKKWNDDFEKDKRDTINKMANTWLGENQTNRFENIKFLLGSDGALNGAIADINKLDKKLREGAISTAKYESEYEKLQKKWSNAIASFSYNPSDNREAMKQWVNMQAQGAAVTLKWSKDGQQLTGVFRNQNNELVKVVATADQFKGTVKGVVQEIKPMKSGIEAFFDSIGSKWQEVMRYMATYVSLRSVWTEFQKGINVVREYDKALTEMNKVSDASMYTLQAFQKESFGIADSVGVTASVVQNSTADWLRLGESFAQAKESAKASAILYNVSEFQDIGSATDALVSASQAYQELSKTDIIDKINYIGNNYSIATDGLASALQRSAAVLKTQGNNLDQAIALITAGNSIIQNPEMVAAGIRTISLRIAGTEAAKNQLVEAGEDVDDFIIQTKSKTQQLIKDYTAVASNSYKGVDVLDDNGNLRSTYEILLDISKVYKEIQKTDKAAGTNRANALVEALAGKNRSNIAASILSAPEMLESVYQDSAFMSEGSANEELNKQLESIEGHVNRLKNTYDELWTSAVNRDAINFFIDMANGALTLVNNLGLVKTAFAGILSVIEFQSTMSGGGFLFGKTGLFTNLFSGQKGQKENQFIDLDIKTLERYNEAYDEFDDKSKAYREAITKDTNKVTKDFLHAQEGLVDIVNAKKLQEGKGDGFSAILENGKELAKGVAASVGTAIVTYAAEWAIGEIWKQVDQKVIHAHEYAVDRLNNAQSIVDTDNNEISVIDEQLKAINAEIRNINSLGGASLAKEGELQRLEDQKKELEAQKELKQAILEMDMLELYSAAEKNAGTKVTGYEFARRGGSSYVEQQWIETEQSQQDAIRNTMKYYDYVVKQREQARSEYVRLEKEDAEGNKKRLSELKQQEEDWGKKAVEVRGKVAKMTADMDVTATTLSNWEKLGHTLDETQQDYINAAKEGKDFAIATKDLGIAVTDASNSQRDFSHSCVQTSAQLTEQKASVDNLKTSYQEIFSLLSSFTGTDIVLDDTQLQKYAYALEYINGVYTLNKEKLLEVAKANNAVQKSSLEEVRRTERMQLLDNIDEIEIYNQKLQEGQKVYNGIDIQDYISQLKQENAQILNNCKVYDYQISQIDNMTSAYQRWLNTGDVSKDSKQFTDVQSSAKNLEELIKTGYFNSEAASHEIDFIIPDDVSRDDKSAILKLAKDYNKYFADGIKGTNKFVKKAMKETLEDGTPLIKQLEDGNYEFGEGVTVQDFMDKFGWSESAVRAMLQELHEAQGWNIDWSLENLDTLEDKVVHSQQVISDYESQIKELETTKSQRTLTEEETKKLDDLKDKLAEVKKEYAEMRDEFSKQLTSNIRDTIKENGGAQTISEGIPEDASDKEISDYLKGKTGVKSEYEVKVYTEDAQKNIEDLETKYKELEKLYNDPFTTKTRKSTIKDTMDEIQVEMDSEKLNLSLLSMLEFDSDGISTESTTQNILSLVGSIDKTLGRISDKIAPPTFTETTGQTVREKFDGLSKKQPTTIQKIQNKASSAFEVPNVSKNPKQVVTEIVKQKVETEVEALNADKVTALFETLRKKQEETTGVKSSTVTVYGIERTLQQFRELYRMQQLVHSGGVYDSSYNPGGAHQVKGNAFARGNDIVGEQGRELVVDPNRGIWYTVGDSGTEMIDLPKNAIVYSHNQTEALLKSGVTTRGKSKGRSFANGNQQYVFGNIDLRHRQPYYWDDGSVSTVLGTSYGMDELSFAVATLLQGNDVRPLGDGEIIWYLEQLVSRSHDPETIYALDRQGFTDPAGNWLHDLIAYVGTDAAYAEYVSSIMHVISDEYERSIGTYARGNAFANGTLVGERGRELVVDPNSGRWYTVGDYGSEMINLPKDAIVYNHQQTEDLLKNGHTGRGHSTGASFVGGNAYAEGPINGGGGLESSTSSGKDAAKSAEKAAKAASDAAEKAKDATDEAKNNMIWIDRAIEHQERKVSKINELVEDDFQTYTERLSDLGELREELALQNEILSDALERRVEEFDKAFQELVEIFGEDVATDLLHKIEVGSVDKDTYKDEFGEDEAGEKKKKALDKVIDAYDEETKLSDKLRDNEKEIRDAVQKEYEFRLNIIEAEKDQLQFEMDTLEHNLDMKDILGRMVTEGDYQDMIDQSEEIADNIERTIDVLEEQLTTVDEGSAKYNEINSQLISAKKELQDIEKQQAEWNEKIMRLPIDRLDKYIGMLENIKKDLQNWISERDTLNITTLGQTIGEQYEIAQEQIEAYQKKEQKYLELIKNYEYGSEKFHETADEIQACQDSVSGLIQEMEELNIQFLKLPIDNITKANEKLQSINSAEQRVLDDYDTALSAVLTLFDKQIERLNDDKDYWDEYYENLIKPEQEKLDLLNEQNEAKQMQYNIDKAQYDLDKARQQKNVQVVRNGRIEYDSDYDAVKNAEDSLADAQHDKVIYDIQQVIDGYEKLNEKKQEELDDEIEAYEDAMNRWQTFEDERTFEKESAEALRLFGEGWEQNIINRTDDREYDIFSKGHIELDRQITANEKQIEANEKMIDLMTRYADAFLSGEMTYEEAVAQYTKLYNDYQSDGALVSQEALAAELAFNNAKDMASALTGNNAITKEQYDSFLSQLEQANTQKELYEGLQKSWVDMAADIKSQLEELKRLAALAEEIAAQRRSSGGSRSSGDSDDGGGEWSKNPTGYGAGTKYNPYGKGTLYEGDAVFTGKSIYIDNSGGDTTVESKSTEVKSSSSSSSGKSHYNHSSASGPASDPELHADGLAGGIIGNIPPTEKFKKLQAMGLKPLEPDEVPAFLHVGEGVVNAIQQSNILKSVGNAFKAGVASIPTDAVKSVENNYTFDCQFGDFILPGVEDTNGFASAMKNNFESIMNQQFSKIF